MFYLTFVLFQPISALVGGWIGAKHWIPIIMVRCPPARVSWSLGLRSDSVEPTEPWSETDVDDLI